MNVAQKLIQTHLIHGEMKVGEEIELKIDQALCQDAAGIGHAGIRSDGFWIV